jgi:hypothetical protein
VSLWPRAEEFLEILEVRAEHEPDPGRRRAFRQVLGAVRELGVSVVAEVLAAAAKKTAGQP